MRKLDHPFLEAETLLSLCIKKNRTQLIANPQDKIPLNLSLKYLWWCYKRRNLIPIAYITKQKHWAGFDLMVTKDTLIPRDETEILCEHITKANSTPPSSILDIGTGSGAIALFMKKKYPNANVSALDISKKALKVAKRNSVQYKLNLNLIESDLLSKKKAKEQFDIIIANLPYLPSDLNISPEVQEEPQCALFSGKDGLDHIKALKVELESKAIKFKQLWLEFLPQQSIEIKRIFKNYKCEFYKDLSGQCFFCKIQ